MQLPKEKTVERYTYADYCEWDDDQRWELIEGIPYAMVSPALRHQRIIRELFFQIANYLKGKACEVLIAPFDVRLNASEEDDTVVQPDLLVVCDSDKLDQRGCKGAPDLVIEILSPSTAKYDLITKFQQYQKAKVPEYWVVDPETETLQVYILNQKGHYICYTYEREAIVPIHVLSECEINMQLVFSE